MSTSKSSTCISCNLQNSVNLKKGMETSQNSVEICRYIFINLDKGGLVPDLSEPAAAKSNRNGGWSWGRFIAEARSSQHRIFNTIIMVIEFKCRSWEDL